MPLFLSNRLRACCSYLDVASFAVITGGPDTAKALLACSFDHILYTGGAAVGRLVLEAAALHLTPVTLELGGKCPVFVDADADVALAAKRIAAYVLALNLLAHFLRDGCL